MKNSKSSTKLFELGIDLAGAADILPNPNDFPVTVLVPSDGAFGMLLFQNGLLLDQLSSLGGKLTSLITYGILPASLSPEAAAVEGAPCMLPPASAVPPRRLLVAFGAAPAGAAAGRAVGWLADASPSRASVPPSLQRALIASPLQLVCIPPPFAAGTKQSVYGLLTGQDLPLTHYEQADGSQLLFMGRSEQDPVGVVEQIQVGAGRPGCAVLQ